jgi:hypothetical protein
MRTIKDSNLAYLITRVTLGLSAPRLRYRILFRVALCYPATTHRPRGCSGKFYSFPLSPSFGLLPSLGGSADDPLMIVYHDDVLVAQIHRRKSAGSLLLLPRLPKRRPRLVSGSGSSHRSSDRASRNRLTTNSTFSSYRPDLLHHTILTPIHSLHT